MTPALTLALALLAPGDAPTAPVRLRTPAAPLTLAHGNYVYGAALAPDGRTLYTACRDGQVRALCPVTGAMLGSFPGGQVRPSCLALSPDGQALAVGDEEGVVHLWAVATRKLRWSMPLGGPAVGALAFAPDGQTLAAGHVGRVVAVRAADGTTTATLPADGMVRSLSFAPDGRALAACTFGSRDVTLYDLTTPGQARTLTGHADDVRAVAFAPDGRTLASGGHDKQVILWDVAAGKPRETLRFTTPVTALAFAPGGHTLAVGGEDQRTVRLWNLPQRVERAVLSTAQDGAVYAVSFTPSGRRLALGIGMPFNSGAAVVWDLGP